MRPKQFYLPRCIGLSLGFLLVYATLPASGAEQTVLALLALYCFAWPHLAYQIAKACLDPLLVERRSMLFDAISAGFFAGCMGFNPIPSIAIIAMISMNNMAFTGPKFAAIGLIFSVLGAVFAYLILDPPFSGYLNEKQMFACMPLLFLYPLSLGYFCYRTTVKLKIQRKDFELLSKTDFLTGLTNRAALNEKINECLNMPDAFLNSSAIALVDLDSFKQINDKYGHVAGDRALQEITRIMRACVRENDTIGRYGGDEFCVILHDVNQSEAVNILERMRMLANQKIADRSGEAIPTLSIGVAMYTPGANTITKWINLADEAMYEAKQRGRNRLVVACSKWSSPI